MTDIDFTALRRFDMTMLLVFREIMRTRKLTLVAKRLGLTQSAISHTLSRLRDGFADPLFLRKPHGLEPTARALELEPAVSTILELAQSQLLSQDQFEPRTATRHLRIAAPDHHSAILGAPLSQLLEQKAPGLRFSFNAAVRHEAIAMLEANTTDLVIGYFNETPPNCEAIKLYQEEYAVISSRNHASFNGSLASYLAARHLLVSFSGDLHGIVDDTLAAQGQTRNVVAGFPQFFPALATVSETNLVATVPKRLAEAYAKRFELALHEPPIAIRSFPISVLWHRRNAKDGAVAWLCQQLQIITSATLG
jgi:DNA-binding transcriptional LysR family regulator